MIHETLVNDVKRSEVCTTALFLEYLTYESGQQQVLQRFCASLPEDRLLHGANDLDALLEKDRYRRSYKVSSTGATLTFHSSLAILAHYASSLVREYSVYDILLY